MARNRSWGLLLVLSGLTLWPGRGEAEGDMSMACGPDFLALVRGDMRGEPVETEDEWVTIIRAIAKVKPAGDLPPEGCLDLAEGLLLKQLGKKYPDQKKRERHFTEIVNEALGASSE